MALISKQFVGAQVFFVDPSIVSESRTCDISSINLYFKYKPDSTFNVTDGAQPSVSIFIAETKFDTPSITRDSGIFTNKIARLPLTEIQTSSDATVPTTFRFREPITVQTNKSYCFIIEYGLSGQFELWTSVQGEILTGTTLISPGPSDKFVGKYYDATTLFVADETTNLDDYISNWRPVPDTSLKFDVKVARYSHSNVPVGANGSIDSDDIIRTSPAANTTANASGVNFNVNFGSYEYVSFNENRSTRAAFIGGQMAYQNTVYYPGGWANSNSYVEITTVRGNNRVTANTFLPNGANFSWNTIFPTVNPENRVVLTDGTKVNIRSVGTIISNTVLQLTEDMSFSNSGAKLMITPTARVSSFNKASPFGIDSAFVMLGNSAANSTVRFVNNTIVAATITNGGTGYSSNDVFYVKGYEEVSGAVRGGYVAVANLVVNATGGITALHFSNLGCGFVNSAAMVAIIANSSSVGNTTANTSNGTSATFTYTIGADIRTEYGSSILRDCEIRNIDLGEFVPYHRVETPPGVGYTIKLETNYIKKANSSVIAGEAFYVNDGVSNNQLDVTMYDINVAESLNEIPVIMSRSNEFHALYEDGSPNDKTTNTSSRSSETIRLITDVSANSDYATVRMGRPAIQFGKYIINNDATNEHTDSGNAYAKGLTKVFDFKRTSEAVKVYLTAYKPANTDIKVYARIYKNEDPDAFDDKNWTELKLADGVGLVSSTSDPLDYVQLEYEFYQVPQTRTALDGTVTLESGNTTVLGAGTDFVTDLAAGDLVYMYQPLFVENHIVAAVESVSNTTAFVMDQSSANASLLAEGMNIEKITYPQQAFLNKQNSNVVRYYNESTSKFDGYEHIAVKIVFLSTTPHRIPRVDDLQITGTSA